MPLGCNQNRLVTLSALCRVAVSDLLTSRFRSPDPNPDRCAEIDSGNKGHKDRSSRLHCFLQLGSCDGVFGTLTFFLSCFLITLVTRKAHKQIQLDQAVEAGTEI